MGRLSNDYSPPGGSGGSSVASGLTPTAVKTGAYTAAANELVSADTTSAGFTVTLPTAPATGVWVGVKKISSDGNTLTIVPAGSGTIDGDANATTATRNAGAVFEHIGSNVWRIVASMTTTGPVGPAGSVSVGTTTTGAAGSSAAVSNSGTPTAAVLNFIVPRGDVGPTGPIGVVQDEGSALTARSALNFIGSAVTATDDAANNRTNITITAPASTAIGRPVAAGTTYYTLPGFLITGNNSETKSAGRKVYVPMLVATPITIDQIAVYISGGAGAGITGRVAIYNADTSWQPTSLVVEPTASTPIDCSSNGLKTVSLSLTLQPGRYLMADVFSAGVICAIATGASEVSGIASSGGFSAIFSWYVSGTYGAFPTTGVPWDTVSTGNSAMHASALVRVSTP